MAMTAEQISDELLRTDMKSDLLNILANIHEEPNYFTKDNVANDIEKIINRFCSGTNIGSVIPNGDGRYSDRSE